MRALLFQIGSSALRVWNFVRGVLGDRAYERYLEATKRAGTAPLSAKAFYVESVERRYSTISRCC